MKKRNISSFCLTFLLIICAGIPCVFAQWGAPYTNSWVKNSNSYVKITITQAGIFKIPFTSLPASFPIDKPDNFKIYHLGQEISIISTNNSEIVFYGVPNDGSSDSLLYRPMSSRINPYTSLYSTSGAYFLTVDNSPGKRSVKESNSIDITLSALPFHVQSDIQVNSQEYSHSTQIYIKPEFLNSFFEDGASKTGSRLISNTLYTYPYQLKNRNVLSSVKPSIKILLHGRSNNSRDVELYVGKNTQGLRRIVTKTVVNFIAQIATLELEASDFSEDGTFFLAFKSTSTIAEDRFSIGFVNITYPQNYIFDDNQILKIFKLPAVSTTKSRVKVSGAGDNGIIYNITDINNPKLISGNPSDFALSRLGNVSENILVTNQISTIPSSQLSLVSFQEIKPSSYNYIIVTNETLEASVKNYAQYRSSSAGGSYRPLIVKIKDIYNQFNYGEVSPVAIRRFIDYMISDGNKEKYLVLFGKSTTFVERMLPELPEDVPAIGYPASDILLVEGLAGSPTDQPAIPVGRISAVNLQQADNYLQKVKDYEQNAEGNYGWRKKVLHLNGGKSAEELSQFKTTLSALDPVVENGFVGGSVTAFSKQSIIEVENANITPEVNEGVGLITYLGHGNQYITDFDLGFVSDISRGYKNTYKYPVMYFNGCSVGNIFNGHLNPDISASDKMPLSMDWLFSNERGAIAVIANSFEGYVSPLVKYLNGFYTNLFSSDQSSTLSLGKIQAETIKIVLSGTKNYFDIGNVHQSLLQGDPAIHVISVSKPDYSVDPIAAITLYSESADKNIGNSSILNTSVLISNLGRNVKADQVPVRVKYSFSNNTEEVITKSVTSFPSQDTLHVALALRGRILINIEVKVDPENTLSEMDKSNNESELPIDWEDAKTQFIYTMGDSKDIIAPVLNVNFNGRFIKNAGIVAPSPIMNFTLQDDRLMQGDTSLLDIYIKNCGDESCDFRRLAYSNNQFNLRTISSHSFSVKLFSQIMAAGVYEILANGRDISGNMTSQSYRVKFEVSETIPDISIIVSPNPASDYVHFEVSSEIGSKITSIQWNIYDTNGILVRSEDVIPNQSSINEWYWTPNISSGLFIYKIIMKNDEGKSEEKSGKIVIVK